jgi:hypothetical protein
MTADVRRLNPQPSEPGPRNDDGLGTREGRDAPLATLPLKLRHVAQERTALLRDITRLTQELDAMAQPGRECPEGEDPQDRANVARPRWPYLVPPVLAGCIGHSAAFVARTGRLILGPGWMVSTAASGMVLHTTIATLSHLSRVCAGITAAPTPPAADGRMVIDNKRTTPSAEFDEP